LVCYWFEKANKQLDAGKCERAGLVATNSIRGGANRRVLDEIAEKDRFIEAWSDEPWVVDGAAVRVSIVCFGDRGKAEGLQLDGAVVRQIHSDLTSDTFDLTKAKRLPENESACFEGGQKHGPFEMDYETARDFLLRPTNPNCRNNSDVIFPYLNAADVVRRSSNTWIIAFPDSLSEREVALYEAPFEYVHAHVKPVRDNDKDSRKRELWWRHHRSRPDLRKAVEGLDRVIVTPVVSKWRIFVWVYGRVLATNLVDVVARDDDTVFGILHSRFHESWSLRLGTSLEDRPRYTPTTTFETFPFPEGLTPNISAKDYAADLRAIAIAKAAKRLDELRNAWLNPPDLIDIVPEVVPGYPDRILPKNEKAAVELKKRTLTNLYNARPQWLADAHRDLDAAVAAAYGWAADISEEDALAKLLALNLARAGAEGQLALEDGESDDD
jgi:type II restriction/modification system DNA methylase subunit YeeA